jgi:hypothetical protein
MALEAPALLSAVVLVAAAALAGGGCRGSVCPEGMKLVDGRSQPGRFVTCQSRREATQQAWIELHEGRRHQRRQLCNLIAGRAHGGYRAWHPGGGRWLEGQYQDGQKAGRWTQWAADGSKVAEGEYRSGSLVEGAPVGGPATCESVGAPPR